jgi:hypothetical protein
VPRWAAIKSRKILTLFAGDGNDARLILKDISAEMQSNLGVSREEGRKLTETS